jgi:hypothetical protein
MIRAMNRMVRAHRCTLSIAAAALMVFWWPTTTSAQLDPLLFVKRVPPTVIVVLDTSMRMMEDGNGFYYDPNTYTVGQDAAAATAMGLTPVLHNTYRRKYKSLQYENVQDSATKFEALDILAVPNTAAEYATFFSSTRLEMAKSGIDLAVSANAGAQYRWGLIKLRQTNPAWRVSPNCDKPVRITANGALSGSAGDTNPCNAGGGGGKFGLYVPTVASSNYSNETQYGGGARVITPAANTSAALLAAVRRPIGDAAGLIPASTGARSFNDRPLTHALEDARDAGIALMAADTAAFRACRNTVIVLVTSGKDDGDAAYRAAHNPETIATALRNVTAGGITKRFPVHVVAIKPDAADVAQLQNIASNSGGTYRNVSSANQIAQAINYAVQHGFARSTEFDAGTSSEFLPVSPVIGTVDLENGKSSTGAALPNTAITSPSGTPLAQRSNIMLTSGFALPSFDGVLRAFRAYKPVADASKPTGWKFTKDGTPLWPDLDGRPSLAGKARTPSDPNARNIYTYIPSGSGAGSVVAFTTANEATLRPHMNDGSSVTDLITFVRSQPLGAVIGSTPAIMDAPSLDPPPDEDYGFQDGTGFAGTYKNRRSLIFFGANDGMIHAVDARTGYEVWAFIPYNLLPKLRTLKDGQPIEQFDYFVDSSPKVAELKINGSWRSMLFIGEGPGGTFYQAFDVTEAGMGVDPNQDDLNAVSAVLGKFDSANESIVFKWAFPDYFSFDPNYTAVFTVTDGTPGGRVRLYGDLKAGASAAEKTVGYTWSDPAVGPLNPDRSTNAVIVGSGYFPDIETAIPSRGGSAPKAGTSLYLINPNTGKLLGNAASCPSVSSGSGSGTGCVNIGDANNPGGQRKNALQADPTAAGESLSHVVNKAYIGDVDGRYWRFRFTDTGSISAAEMVNTAQPIYASSALLFIGSSDVYMFFATGSDLLASTAPGGVGTFSLYGLKDNYPGAGATTKFTRALAAVTNTAATGLATGERPSTSPSVAGDIVFYTTTTETAATPCADFSGKLYGLTYAGGAAYDSNNNGKIDNNESPVAKTIAGRATAPFIVDQHLYFGSSSATGANVEAFGDPDDFNNGVGQVGVRILSWREIR